MPLPTIEQIEDRLLRSDEHWPHLTRDQAVRSMYYIMRNEFEKMTPDEFKEWRESQ